MSILFNYILIKIAAIKFLPKMTSVQIANVRTCFEHEACCVLRGGVTAMARVTAAAAARCRRFFHSANFSGWMRCRQLEVNQKLQALHVEALCRAVGTTGAPIAPRFNHPPPPAWPRRGVIVVASYYCSVYSYFWSVRSEKVTKKR